MVNKKVLEQALEAAKQGKRKQARDIFTRLLTQNPREAELWIYMSAVVDTDKEKVYCLKKAISLDPKNKTAQYGLSLFGARPPDDRVKPIKPTRQREWVIKDLIKKVEAEKPATKTSLRPSASVSRIALFVLFGLITIVIIFLVIFGNPFSDKDGFALAFRATNTPRPLLADRILTPTATITLLPTYDGLTAHLKTLEATFTPTPRYIATEHNTSEAYSLAMNAIDQKEWEKALGFLNQIEPMTADIRYHQGDVYMEMDETFEAEKYYQYALSINEQFGPAFLGVAKAQLVRDPLANVGEILSKAITFDPLLYEAYYVRGKHFLNKKSYELARTDLEFALEHIPELPLLHLSLGRLYIDIGEFELALTHSRIANDLDLTLILSYYYLGRSQYENGMNLEAIQNLSTFLVYEPDSQYANYYIGRAYQDIGYHENAIEYLTESLILSPNLFWANYYRGISRQALSNYEIALKDFDAAARSYPKDFYPVLEKGKTQMMMGNYNEGYRTLNANKIYATNDEKKVHHHFWLATALEALREEFYDDAVLEWQALLDLPFEVVPPEWREMALQRVQYGKPLSSPTPYPTLTPAP